jgi:glycosyltransferase involved in cell wall biosynthesis
MKILYTMTGDFGTGSGVVVQGVRQELIKKGHEVKVFYLSHNDPQNEQEDVLNFPATYEGVDLPTFPSLLPGPSPGSPNGEAWLLKDLNNRQFDAYFGYIKENLSRCIEEFSPDVIDCHHVWAIDAVVRELGYRYVCSAHNSDQMGFDLDARMHPITKESAKDAEYVFAPSDWVKKRVMGCYDVESFKVPVIPTGFNQEIFRSMYSGPEVMAKYGVESDLPLITFAGKLSSNKGADTLLKANKIIQERYPARLVMFGSGDLGSFSDATRAEFSLENVVFLGHKSHQEIADVHNCARLSVVPSIDEGFCISGIEAMGCGLPLVASDIEGIPYDVASRFKVGNVEGLAEAVIDLLELPDEKYLPLRKKAVNVASEFSWKRVTDDRLIFYEDVANLGIRR